ncbi:hypothetical protein D3C71_1486820 [compost metagenome]
MAVRVLDQHAACQQAFAPQAGAAGVGFQLDRQHQPAPAHFAHGAGQRAQAFQEVGADRRGVFDHAFVGQHAQRGAGNGAGQRIAAEGAAMLSRLEHSQHVRVGEDG